MVDQLHQNPQDDAISGSLLPSRESQTFSHERSHERSVKVLNSGSQALWMLWRRSWKRSHPECP